MNPDRTRGRVAWPRFALLFVPALLSLTLLVAGAATGMVPVALALAGPQGVKVTMKKFYTDGTATFPSFFDTHSGEHRTVLPVTLRNLRVQGLCVSTTASTPLGRYVLRFTSPDNHAPIDVGDATFAVDNVSHIDFSGDSVGINYGAKTADGTPTDTGIPGYVPLNIDGITFGLTATFRWVIANQIRVSGISLAAGANQRECY